MLRFAQHAQPALLCRDIQSQDTPKGNFLTIDSSVFNLLTSNDPELPRELVVDEDGQDRFRKYLPTDRTFVNTIENYPYPYVLGGLCWEFPCVMPSDWVAQHRHQPNNPVTVRDWKAALDATVLKTRRVLPGLPSARLDSQRAGRRSHRPRGDEARQEGEVPDLPRSAGATEQELAGRPTAARRRRRATMACVCSISTTMATWMWLSAMRQVKQTRRWSPKKRTWITSDFPLSLVKAGGRFGVVRPDGHASLLVRNETVAGAWHFKRRQMDRRDKPSRWPAIAGAEDLHESRRDAIAACACATWTAMAAAN